ncbi:pseudouridine synthase [Vibrio lentus]|nr:pseudouridine synthase [Vibrio lentus]
MRGDITDRPRQLVCHEHGRNAETHWEAVSTNNGKTKVHLYPKTGRTHQLRVHCAHPSGLGVPIRGDDLYGYKRERLHLHAGYLKLSSQQLASGSSLKCRQSFRLPLSIHSFVSLKQFRVLHLLKDAEP